MPAILMASVIATKRWHISLVSQPFPLEEKEVLYVEVVAPGTEVPCRGGSLTITKGTSRGLTFRPSYMQ
jgi:hypothetical protein